MRYIRYLIPLILILTSCYDAGEYRTYNGRCVECGYFTYLIGAATAILTSEGQRDTLHNEPYIDRKNGKKHFHSMSYKLYFYWCKYGHWNKVIESRIPCPTCGFDWWIAPVKFINEQQSRDRK